MHSPLDTTIARLLKHEEKLNESAVGPIEKARPHVQGKTGRFEENFSSPF